MPDPHRSKSVMKKNIIGIFSKSSPSQSETCIFPPNLGFLNIVRRNRLNRKQQAGTKGTPIPVL